MAEQSNGQVITHYPRDGVTYMRGQCGAHSIRSSDRVESVTCEKCKKLIAEGCKQF